MSKIFGNQVLYIEENLLACLEYINTNIEKYNIDIFHFTNSKFYQNFLYYINSNTIINSKIDILYSSIENYQVFEEHQSNMNFKSVLRIQNSLEDFFTKKNEFFYYYFFTRNLHDTFLLYNLSQIENLSDIKICIEDINNTKNLINNFENNIDGIKEILLFEEYNKIKIFDEIEYLSYKYEFITLNDKGIVCEIVKKFIEQSENNFENLSFLKKSYKEIYLDSEIFKYYDNEETYKKKERDYNERKCILNSKLCLQELQIFNLNEFNNQIDNLKNEIILNKKKKKTYDFDLSTQKKENNNKTIIKEKELNDKINFDKNLIDNLDSKIFNIKELLNKLKKNSNTKLYVNELKIIQDKLLKYPEEQKYLQRQEFLKKEIRTIMEQDQMEIKIQSNKLNQFIEEKNKLMTDIAKTLVMITRMKEKNILKNKNLTSDEFSFKIKEVENHLEYLEEERDKKQFAIDNLKKINNNLNEDLELDYKDLTDFKTKYNIENEKIFIEYHLAIQNKEKFESYISLVEEKTEINNELDKKINECLNTSFFTNYEYEFKKKCKELYEDKILNYHSIESKTLSYIINLIMDHHLYDFYSNIVFDMCRVLPSKYSRNIKIIINNHITEILEDMNFDFNLKNSNSILEEYKQDKIVKINNSNLDNLEILIKKKNKIIEYLKKVAQIKHELSILEIM